MQNSLAVCLSRVRQLQHQFHMMGEHGSERAQAGAECADALAPLIDLLCQARFTSSAGEQHPDACPVCGALRDT